MNKIFIFAVALSALLFTVNAAFELDDASFTGAPVKVLGSGDTTNYQYPFVSRFINSSFIVLWGFYGVGDTAPITYNAYRRLFNSADLSVAGNDMSVTLGISLMTTPLFASSTDGYVAIAGYTQTISNGTTTSAIDVFIFSSDIEEASVIERVTLASTTNKTITYLPYNLWFDDDYFYIVYTQAVNGAEESIYIVAFKRNGGDLKFNPVSVNTNTLSGDLNVVASSTGRHAVVAWRENIQGQVVFAVVNTNTAEVGSEIVIATDSGTTTFAPAAIVFSGDYYSILLTQTGANGDVTGLAASYSSGTASTLSFSLATGYSTISVSAVSNYYDGWFAITRQSSQTGKTITGTEETLQLYNYTSPPNSTTNIPSVLATDGSVVQGFTLPNQSYYVLILDDYDGESGIWTQGYVGQVFTKISASTFGAALKAVLTVISATVALLFVF